MNVSNTLCIYENLSNAQEWLKIIEIYNRLVEWLGLEGSLKIIYIQTPNPRQGCFPLDQASQGPIYCHPLISTYKMEIKLQWHLKNPDLALPFATGILYHFRSVSHLVSLETLSTLNLGRPGRECSASCGTESSTFLFPICKPWTKLLLLSHCSPIIRVFSAAGIFSTNLTQVQKTLSNYQP